MQQLLNQEITVASIPENSPNMALTTTETSPTTTDATNAMVESCFHHV